MSPMAKVLIVEDDEVIAKGMARHLGAAGFDATWVGNGEQGLARLRYDRPDACVLDLMLPGLDGMVVCRQIRDVSDVPILILTAREDTYDEVSGLEQGADDFVNKPVQPRVLLARLRALLRRTQTKAVGDSRVLEFGALHIMTSDRSVTWRGQPCVLSNTEYKLLLVLAEAAGRVLSRDELLKKMRGIEFDGLDRSIDNCISKLRRKFDDNMSEKIKTVWGEGYLFSPSAWN